MQTYRFRTFIFGLFIGILFGWLIRSGFEWGGENPSHNASTAIGDYSHPVKNSDVGEFAHLENSSVTSPGKLKHFPFSRPEIGNPVTNLTAFELGFSSASIDRAEAIFKSLKSDTEREEFLSAVITKFAVENPKETLGLIKSLQDPNSKNLLSLEFAQTLAHHAPLNAIEVLANELDGPEFHMCALEVMDIWARDSPKDALSWAMSWPQQDARFQLAEAALVASAEVDPRNAISMLEDQKAWTETERKALQSQLALVWGTASPREALIWAVPISVSGDSEPLETVLRQWLETSSEEAMNAAQKIEIKSDYSKFFSKTLFSEWAESEPEIALAWVDQHPDSKNFQNEKMVAFESWIQREPISALRYVEKLGMNDAGAELRGRAALEAAKILSSLPMVGEQKIPEDQIKMLKEMAQKATLDPE